MTSQAHVVIPAAGSGSRMVGAPVPKQYLPLGDSTVLGETLRRLQRCPSVGSVTVAIREQDRALYDGTLGRAGECDKVEFPVVGGKKRSDSVRAGVEAIPAGAEIVLIHDAVRPWISVDLVERVVEGARCYGAVIPTVAVKDTVKEIDAGRVVATPDRTRLVLAQTPQGFHKSVLLEAFAALPNGSSTDEAGLVERAGGTVYLVEGDYENVKITTMEDLDYAAHVTAPLRIGLGYDVHAFSSEAADALVLGGVRIAHHRRLEGHSDADVLSHAIIDALLGAARMGDIGRLYPDTDAQYEGISSLCLVADVRERLGAAGLTVVNIDAVVMAQAPRLAGHAEEMTRVIAGKLRIAAEAVSVKATTTEGLGFVGREEGIAAQAVAQIALG
ncbi:MAG: 2-C-methyl-D-erythritol 4-phosphate cytidylyltransferase [Candidatus Latescibacterota bacterium]|nr:2-C-methyl-D-erythritol 4-phosphate cytidylyltransferase [Candidatus Latescibacterota bacterium]